MVEPTRPTWWRFLQKFLLLALIVPVLLFLTVITWGIILVPVVGILWLAPLAALNYLLWGRSLSQASQESAEKK